MAKKTVNEIHAQVLLLPRLPFALEKSLETVTTFMKSCCQRDNSWKAVEGGGAYIKPRNRWNM